MIDWLYRLTIEVTLLIGLVMILRPWVRALLGARVAYWLWLIPLIRVFIWYKPEVPLVFLESSSLAEGEKLLRVFPNPDVLVVAHSLNLSFIWAAGVSVFIIIRFYQYFQLQKHLKQHSQSVEFEKLQVVLTSPSKNIQYFSSALPATPFVTGLFSPRIYLPENFNEQFNQVQRELILKHEYGHILRCDLFIQLIAELVRALFWFNPVVHLASRAFRHDQELACDFQVLKQSSAEERLEYGHALLSGLHAHVLPASLAFFNLKKERIMMLEKHKNSLWNNVLGIAICLLVAVFAMTKAPSAIAGSDKWTDEPITLNFEKIPLNTLTKMVFDFAGKQVTGLEQLENNVVSLKVENVQAIEVAHVLLHCHGFKMVSEQDIYRIEQDDSTSDKTTKSSQCILAELKA